MKKILCMLLLFSVLFVGCGGETEESSNAASSEESKVEMPYEIYNYEYMKAVWLSQFDMESIYKDGDVQRNKVDFISLVETVLDNVENYGYNTVIVQVRPYADSFYPSELYPVSSFVSGAYGNEDIYDPFEIIVDEAHERGLSVHAWLNPMRAMLASEIVNVPDKYLIKQWYNDQTFDRVVELNGRIYLNPYYAEVRELIADGAREVAQKYDIDGVHIDDYFYPTTDPSFDQQSFNSSILTDSNYTPNSDINKKLAEFRYNNINEMVSGMYSAVKAVDEDLLFGISPAGNIKTTYESYYTDVYKWCSEDGYLDYICPQIYFGLEHGTHDFKKVYNTWNAIIKNENVRMIVGMTLGKAQSGVDNYAGVGKNEWAENKDVIKRCFEFLSTQPDCSGISMFCYQYMYDPVSGESVAETRLERDNAKDAMASLGE